MVILQFNKLIRNKWIWGVFAVTVAVVFCLPDDFLRGDSAAQDASSVSTLGGQPVDMKTFVDIANEIREGAQRQNARLSTSDVNLQAWENYATLDSAEKNGIVATDAEIMNDIRNYPAFQQNGAFSFPVYESVLRANSLTPERFERMRKRNLTQVRMGQAIMQGLWCSPMELDRMLDDMTDVFTVKVANFSQSKKDADAVKLDDDGLKKWYDENVDSLELPERTKIRFVKFDATDATLQAKMIVSEDEMRDRYDETVDKYTSTDTNGVEVVKSFDEVKGEIEKDLRLQAAVECFETNLNFRVYATASVEGVSRLEEIAKEDGLKIQTSDWFSTTGGYQEGFMKSAYTILPGAKDFTEKVNELDPEINDYRYGIVSSANAVWLIERIETSPKHTPTFEEAKEAIRPRALRAAKADAFKAAVEAVAKKGVDAVLASGNVSTNYVFCAVDLKQNAFPDQGAVVRAATKLMKGEISEFVSTGTGRGLLVVCEDRTEGDVSKEMIVRSQVQQSVEAAAARRVASDWTKWNLARLGYTTTSATSVEKTDDDE